MKRWQLYALALLTVGYAVLSHYSNSSSNGRSLAAALSLAPVMLLGAYIMWRKAALWVTLSIVAASAAGLYTYWPAIEKNYEWADLVQQCGIYALIALAFGMSLMPGREPLCAQLAAKLHGPLTTAEIAYARRATVAWAAFYVLVAAAILALFFLASLRVWSFFVNFAVFGLIALMVTADHVIRRRLLPVRSGPGLVAALRQSLVG